MTRTLLLMTMTLVSTACATAAPTTGSTATPPVVNEPAPTSMPAALASESTLAMSNESSWVIVSSYQWTFRFPNGWRTLSSEEINAAAAQFTGGIAEVLEADPNWRKHLMLAAVEVNPAEFHRVVPTLKVTLQAEHPMGPLSEICEGMVRNTVAMVPDMTIIRNEPTQVAGQIGQQCDVTYSGQIVGEMGTETHRMQQYTTMLLQGGHFLQFSLATREGGDSEALTRTLESIREVTIAN